MAKISLQEILDSLSDLRKAPVTDASIEALGKALQHSNCVVVGKAAKIIGELEIDVLSPNLAKAFDQFMDKPDKGCTAKGAIAEALYQLGAPADALFIRGIRHRQLEGSFGPPVDVAIDLRGSCAMGLVRMGHPDVMIELVDLLADPEPGARLMAARAIGYSEQPMGVGILRIKALVGDRDAMVVGECLASLMKIDPRGSLEFVGRFLYGDEEIADLAALALGASRLNEALDLLKKWHSSCADSGARKTAMLAIAMLRHESAVVFLLELLKEDSSADALAALEALAIYRHDPAILPRVEGVISKRKDKLALHDELKRLFEA